MEYYSPIKRNEMEVFVMRWMELESVIQSEVSQKEKNKYSMLPYDPAIPLLGIYPEKAIIQKDTCTPMFIEELFTIARTWKQPKCPSTDEWIKKMLHIYNGILLSHKKE